MPHAPQTITPSFTVADADRLIAFLTATFGATLIRVNRYDDNRIQHARLMIGDSLVMVNDSTDTYPVNASQMHIDVEDADSTYETALQSGATSLMAPNTRPHGDRMAGVRDPCGNTWWIANAPTEGQGALPRAFKTRSPGVFLQK